MEYVEYNCFLQLQFHSTLYSCEVYVWSMALSSSAAFAHILSGFIRDLSQVVEKGSCVFNSRLIKSNYVNM